MIATVKEEPQRLRTTEETKGQLNIVHELCKKVATVEGTTTLPTCVLKGILFIFKDAERVGLVSMSNFHDHDILRCLLTK